MFKRLAGVLALVAVIAAVVYWRARQPRWEDAPRIERRVLVVDYTVPFDNYREHAGLIWLLNHYRVAAPAGAPSWAPHNYVGYNPCDRAHPRSLSAVDLSAIDLVYIADTYGVYRDDLVDIPNRRAHMDFSTLEFGGLSDADAAALASFASRGKTVISEFNSFATPTGAGPRAVMEELHGVRWTGWVGRVFADPRDTDDVPRWLPREFAKQFPDRPYPTEPSLLLVDDDGRLRLFSAPTLAGVTPRIRLTPAGVAALATEVEPTGYYFWFDVVEPAPETTVLATFEMPDLDGLPELLDEIGVARLPAVVERRVAGGVRAYLAGDFADTEFDPGPYDRRDAISKGREIAGRVSGPSSAPLFWRLYAPLVERWLRSE